MTEFVKKQDVIDALNIISDKMTYDGQAVMKQAADIVRDIVPADVREVVHAKWILSGGYWRCSACGTKALLKLDKAKGNEKEYAPQRTDFCPKCGAKMDKEESS